MNVLIKLIIIMSHGVNFLYTVLLGPSRCPLNAQIQKNVIKWVFPSGCGNICPVSQDCEDPNPLIRALAVRTMGCIRVDKITEYLCEPLRKCLKDEDPYVRKTAAVCVAKLHDINAQMVEDQGFLDSLRDLIADSNPMVGPAFFVLLY